MFLFSSATHASSCEKQADFVLELNPVHCIITQNNKIQNQLSDQFIGDNPVEKALLDSFDGKPIVIDAKGGAFFLLSYPDSLRSNHQACAALMSQSSIKVTAKSRMGGCCNQSSIPQEVIPSCYAKSYLNAIGETSGNEHLMTKFGWVYAVTRMQDFTKPSKHREQTKIVSTHSQVTKELNHLSDLIKAFSEQNGISVILDPRVRARVAFSIKDGVDITDQDFYSTVITAGFGIYTLNEIMYIEPLSGIKLSSLPVLDRNELGNYPTRMIATIVYSNTNKPLDTVMAQIESLIPSWGALRHDRVSGSIIVVATINTLAEIERILYR